METNFFTKGTRVRVKGNDGVDDYALKQFLGKCGYVEGFNKVNPIMIDVSLEEEEDIIPFYPAELEHLFPGAPVHPSDERPDFSKAEEINLIAENERLKTIINDLRQAIVDISSAVEKASSTTLAVLKDVNNSEL